MYQNAMNVQHQARMVLDGPRRPPRQKYESATPGAQCALHSLDACPFAEITLSTTGPQNKS
eukprot:1297227-Amphidinium_carterae.2